MRVVMYYNNSDVRIEEMPRPEIADGEILVKVMASGICGSDVMEWYRVKKAPLVLGHEIAGEITDIGKGVERFKKGMRVFVSHHVPCGSCQHCKASHETACKTLHTTNYTPGGFSEYIRVPRINVEKGTFLLPDNISFEEATFIEPLACVIRGQRLVGLKKGQTVLILGGGISGLLHLLLARAGGAGRIIMTDISGYRKKIAAKLGADYVLDGNEDVPQKLLGINNNMRADLVILCTSAVPAFNQALRSVESGGTVLFFAPTNPETDIPVPVNEFWRREIKLMTSYANSPKDALEAINMIRDGRVKVKDLITHSLGLNEAGLGFRLTSEGGESVKVILKPHKTQ